MQFGVVSPLKAFYILPVEISWIHPYLYDPREKSHHIPFPCIIKVWIQSALFKSFHPFIKFKCSAQLSNLQPFSQAFIKPSLISVLPLRIYLPNMLNFDSCQLYFTCFGTDFFKYSCFSLFSPYHSGQPTEML